VLKVFLEKINTSMKKGITELYSFMDDFYKIYTEYEKKKIPSIINTKKP